MEFPLTNITNPAMQHLNRAVAPSLETADLCQSASLSAASNGNSPVYGPTVNTFHEQFVNVGPVDPNGSGQRKNQGNRKNRSQNNNQQSQQQHSHGLSPTNSSLYTGPQTMVPNPRSTQGPVGYPGQETEGQQQGQQQGYGQQGPQGGGTLTSQLDSDEMEYQRLEEFAALQQQLQMIQYSNDAMQCYFNQMGMSPHSGHMQQGGGSPMMQYQQGGYGQQGFGGFGGQQDMQSQSGSGGGSPHNGGFTMPPAPTMAAMDYHQMQLAQQNPSQEDQQPSAQRATVVSTPVKSPTTTDSSAKAAPMTPEPSHNKKFNKNAQPTVHQPMSTPEDPCPCLHCLKAKLLSTPKQQSGASVDSQDASFSQHGASPEDFTPVPTSDYKQQYQQFNTPNRNTRRGNNTNDGGYPSRNSNDRRSQDRAPNQHHHKHQNQGQQHQTSPAQPRARELFTVATPPKFKVQVAGHFGRKFHIKSSLEVAKGDYVIFDGDRGQDLGEVAEVTLMSEKETKEAKEKNQSQGGHQSHHPRRGAELIQRKANDVEVTRWRTSLMEDGVRASQVCSQLAKEHGLNFTVRCASYQFDSKKLTFFYESSDRVDFRKLLVEMYSRYHCRIWMEQTSELAFVPAAESSSQQ